MARKKKAVDSSAGQSDEKKAIKIAMFVSEHGAGYYANHAEVGHSKHDFFLLFGRMPTKLTPSTLAAVRAAGEVQITAEVQVQVPPTLIPGLIRALTIQKEAFEKEFGPIADGSATPTPKVKH